MEQAVRRQFKRDALRRAAALRQRLLAVLIEPQPHVTEASAEELGSLAREYHEYAEFLGMIEEVNTFTNFADSLKICFHLYKWVYTTMSALPDGRRFLEAAQAQALFMQNTLNKKEEVNTSVQNLLLLWLQQVRDIQSLSEVDNIVKSLGSIELPSVYFVAPKPKDFRAPYYKAEGENDKLRDTYVVKVAFQIEGQYLVIPQAIRSEIQHDLICELMVFAWPEGCGLLQIDYISTLATGMFHISSFVFSQKDGNSQIKKGYCVFPYAQSLSSEPHIIKVRARFVSEADQQSIMARVIGHTELQIRSLNEKSYPILSGYPTVDIQIPQILNDVQQNTPHINPQDLADFTRCLVYLARYTGMVLQTSVFKGRKVKETRDFQQHMLSSLRMTEMGAEVTEGERTSGGILDLRYRNIVIELKVETGISDRDKLRTAYISQPSQYTAHSVPLSFTCILDMTEKQNPPANIANNITLEVPALHGFEAVQPLYPSKVVVIIIDGNIRSPSDYS